MRLGRLLRSTLTLVLLLVAVVGGSSAGRAATPVKPTITYTPKSLILTLGQPMQPLVPTYAGTPGAVWTVSPGLPAGLGLDPASGTISGTPSALSLQAPYTVTATNAAGSGTASLKFKVIDLPPAISYPGTSFVFTKGVPFTPVLPASTGGAVTAWTVSPALPASLTFDPASGTVGGAPTALHAASAFTVKATNTGGSATATFTVAVIDLPPAFSYAQDAFTLTLGKAASVVPTSTGGAATTWTVSPALPAGLTLGSASGRITGTPTALSPATAYVVTAGNTGGSASATLTLTVLDRAPAFHFNPTSYVLTQATAAPAMAPIATGGAVLAWSVSPDLPAGLAQDPATGVIAGTPTGTSLRTTYGITGSNAAGSATANLTLTVNALAPVIAYTPASYAFLAGSAIAPVTPTVGRGQVAAWSISPAPPAGLDFSAATGVLSGTPAGASAAATYTVTAVNGVGSGTATLTLLVNALPAAPTVALVPYITAGGSAAASTQDQGAGMSYAWTVTGGTLSGGQGTPAITFSAGAPGPLTATVTVSDAGGAVAGTGSATVVPAPAIASFAPSSLSTGPGTHVTLTGVFTPGPGGTASVDQGVGAVASGLPAATPALGQPTTFTLTVTNAAGAAVTATTRVIAGTLAVLAGTPNFQGTLDGDRATAMLGAPAGLALAGPDQLFLMDSYNNGGTIRTLALAGAALPYGTVTTVAGTPGYIGFADAAPASFDFPQGCATDAAGNLYVADTVNHLIRKRDASGVVSTYAGIAGVAGAQDGPLGQATFADPSGVAVDAQGNVYVADSGNNLIRQIDPAQVVTTFAGTGAAGATDGAALGAATFNYPVGIALDAQGNLYVSDAVPGSGDVRELSGGLVSTLATGLNTPMGLAVDGSFNVYVAVSQDQTIARIAPGPVVTTLAGQSGIAGSADGDALLATFNGPSFLTLDGSGNLYLSDTFNATVRELSAGGQVTTLAGRAANPGTADGSGSAAQFNQPWAIAQGPSGNYYIADTNNNSIRMMTPGGTVTTLAGSPAGASGSADGSGVDARFLTPISVAVDASENVYVADYGNSTIRKVVPGPTAALTQVTTVVGQPGLKGHTDGDGRTAALLRRPQGVACDAAGDLFIADTRNRTIRQMTPDGNVTTLAGVVGVIGSGDGPALSATFDTPQGLVVGPDGTLYIIDVVASTIRTLSADGTTVATFAGTPYVYGPTDGVGPAAAFYTPNFGAFDPAGNLYVNDFGRIRRISPAAKVETIIGTPGVFANAPGPLPAAIAPIGLALDPVAGNLCIVVPDGVLVAPY